VYGAAVSNNYFQYRVSQFVRLGLRQTPKAPFSTKTLPENVPRYGQPICGEASPFVMIAYQHCRSAGIRTIGR
jgi:hypothetical protein